VKQSDWTTELIQRSELAAEVPQLIRCGRKALCESGRTDLGVHHALATYCGLHEARLSAWGEKHPSFDAAEPPGILATIRTRRNHKPSPGPRDLVRGPV
jgi:hypothetical protein